jgi:putative phosphoesterase
MRIGILSDTHDQVGRTELAVCRLIDVGAEALVHCGDLTGPEIVYELAGLPSYYVFGNNDFDEDCLRRAMNATGGTCLGYGGEIMLAGRRIAVTHGDSSRELRRLSGSDPDYLLFGHAHVVSDARVGRTRFINPGALHRAATWTVALLDLDTDALQILNITDLSRGTGKIGRD